MSGKPVRLSGNLTAIDFESVRSEIAFYAATGAWRDGVRPGVIFEGGALRGVVSAGYGLALTEFVGPELLSAIYGASSGGLNAIYYASRRLDVALKIYEENATDPLCTNIWRFPNVLNPDWLVDEWMFKSRTFDLAAINRQKPHIWLSLTDLDNGKPRYFNVKGADENLLRQAMKATCYAPLVSNAFQVIDGHRYSDGAISDAIPYDKAIADGCTHLICLLTRPPEYRKGYGRLVRALEAARLFHHTPALRAAYFEKDSEYSALLERFYVTGGANTVPTIVLHPASKAEMPGNLETRPDVIARMGRLAYELGKTALRDSVGRSAALAST